MNKLIRLILISTVVNNIHSGCCDCCHHSCRERPANTKPYKTDSSTKTPEEKKPEEKPKTEPKPDGKPNSPIEDNTKTFPEVQPKEEKPLVEENTKTPAESTKTDGVAITAEGLNIGGNIIKPLAEKDKTKDIINEYGKETVKCFKLNSKKEYDLLANSNDKLRDYKGEYISALSKTSDGKYVFYELDENAKTIDIFTKNLTEIIIRDLTGCKNLANMLSSCDNIVRVSFKNIDTSDATIMNRMFYFCKNLKTLDLSAFNTMNVTQMEDMFYNSESLETLNISSFNTKNVTTMRNMFSDCKKLKKLEFPDSFDTSNVKDMFAMFYNCESLTELNVLNKFKTEKVVDMRYMFSGMSIESLDLSSFDTCNVADMSYMFKDCRNLRELRLGTNFVVKKRNSKVKNEFNKETVFSRTGIFEGCVSLECVITNKSDDNLLDALNTTLPYKDFVFKDKKSDDVAESGYYRIKTLGKYKKKVK